MLGIIRRHKRKLRVALACIASCALLLIVCDQIVRRAAMGRCFGDIAAIPANRVGLVLGTNNLAADGRPNVFYGSRINAAAALFKAGKVEYLLVSGDNGKKDYDEPATMKRDLVAAGVPAEKIYQDCAGFRTLDSIVRAREVFGLKSVTIVSQRFHDERALYLARQFGVDAVALDAGQRCSRWFTFKMAAREMLARAAAVADTSILHTKPRFLGPPIVIGVDPDVRR